MTHFVTAKIRRPEPEINLAQVPYTTTDGAGDAPTLLGDNAGDVQAFFNGQSNLWGAGRDLDSAIGSCLRNAASSPELSGFVMPKKFQGESDTSVGSAARAGAIEGLQYLGVVDGT